MKDAVEILVVVNGSEVNGGGIWKLISNHVLHW